MVADAWPSICWTTFTSAPDAKLVTGRLNGGIEDCMSKVLQAKQATLRCGEDEVVGLLGGDDGEQFEEHRQARD